MGNFGLGEMLFIGIVALLLFGPQRLPEVSRTVGRAVREFRQVTSGLTQDVRSEWAAISDLRPPAVPAAETQAGQPPVPPGRAS